MRVLIKDAGVASAEIRGGSGTFTARSQEGWVELPNGERRKVRVRLPRDNQGYPVGAYDVLDESFTVGQYGDLQLATVLHLRAVAPGK